MATCVSSHSPHAWVAAERVARIAHQARVRLDDPSLRAPVVDAGLFGEGREPVPSLGVDRSHLLGDPVDF